MKLVEKVPGATEICSYAKLDQFIVTNKSGEASVWNKDLKKVSKLKIHLKWLQFVTSDDDLLCMPSIDIGDQFSLNLVQNSAVVVQSAQPCIRISGQLSSL